MGEVRTIGALLFEGFELLDVFGPLEAFGMLAAAGQHRVVTVASAAAAVKSAQQVRALADYGFSDCPHLDLLLVPGGIGTRQEVNNQPLLAWIRERSAQAEIVMSVCTGAALLAKAGVLDGRRATSNKLRFEWVVSQGPNVKWVKQARWVDDGKFSTSSGVSAGIDMTLAVIERIAGSEAAEQIRIAMEYDRHRDSTWDPFAKIHGLVD